jgi:hypothetical protein
MDLHHAVSLTKPAAQLHYVRGACFVVIYNAACTFFFVQTYGSLGIGPFHYRIGDLAALGAPFSACFY